MVLIHQVWSDRTGTPRECTNGGQERGRGEKGEEEAGAGTTRAREARGGAATEGGGTATEIMQPLTPPAEPKIFLGPAPDPSSPNTPQPHNFVFLPLLSAPKGPTEERWLLWRMCQQHHCKPTFAKPTPFSLTSQFPSSCEHLKYTHIIATINTNPKNAN